MLPSLVLVTSLAWRCSGGTLFLPSISRGGGPPEGWWRGFLESEGPLHRVTRGPPPLQMQGRIGDKPMRLKILLAASVLAFAAPLAAAPSDDFRVLLDEHYRWLLRNSPTYATALGVRD